MRRASFLLTIALLVPVACVDDNYIDCGGDDVPVLGAMALTLQLATSCPEPPDFSYQGIDYHVSCRLVDDSRVGRVLEADGGETSYSGARKIVGIPSDHALILEGGSGCGDETRVAFAHGATRGEVIMLRRPAETRGVLEQAKSESVSQGSGYPFKLYTHCGVDWSVDFDGAFWVAMNPGFAGRGHYEELGDPIDRGEMTLVTEEKARYLSKTGVRIAFARAGETKLITPCF